jgi:signal transduction histidine kinase
VEVAAFRIALEAITNVIRHAGARHCDVRLSVDDALLLEVVDDGRGLAADRPAGVGLDSMRERAAELGGWCRIEGLPGGGTRVHASLPLALRSAPGVPAVASGA